MARLPLFVAIILLSLCAAVARAGNEDTSRYLAELRSTDEAIHLHAIDVLGEQGEATPEVLRALSAQLKNDSPTVRAHAAHAFGHLGAGARPAAEALAPLLVDPDAGVRRMAIRAWGRIRPGPAVSVPLLSNVIKDADPAIRTEALDILAEIGKPAVPMLSRLLSREKAVYWCCIVLGEIGPDAAEAAPALVDVLKNNPRPEVRREAALALGLVGPAAAESVPALTDALSDNDVAVGTGAAFALGRIGPKAKAAESSLVKCAASTDPLLKTVSVWALAKIDPQNEARKQAAVTQLVAALKSERPGLRHAAIRGLADLKPSPETVLPAVKVVVQDADKNVAGAAVQVLALLGDPAIPALIDALKREDLRPTVIRVLGRMGSRAKAATPAFVKIVKTDKNAPTRSEALLALAAIGADAAEVVPLAVEALRAPQDDVCCAACFALGKIGKSAAAAESELRQKLGDANESAALAAAWALVRIDPASSEVATATVPLLVKGLADSEPRVRVEAAASLQLLGPLARDAMPALTKASRDNDETVRAAVAEALKAVGHDLARGK